MLRFVVALECEARPLVEHWGLGPDPAHQAFKVFRRDDVALVVSGIGKAAAAAATAYLHLAAGGGRDAAWINAGIAGHRERAVGEAVIAHKVRDLASGRTWHPTPLAPAPCESCEVVTVDRPETSFAEPVAYEMEAAGFYAIACRFTTHALVHCLKVVSDGPRAKNSEACVTKLTATKVTRLVADRLDAIARLAETCDSLSREVRREGLLQGAGSA